MNRLAQQIRKQLKNLPTGSNGPVVVVVGNVETTTINQHGSGNTINYKSSVGNTSDTYVIGLETENRMLRDEVLFLRSLLSTSTKPTL